MHKWNQEIEKHLEVIFETYKGEKKTLKYNFCVSIISMLSYLQFLS